jgi:general L-amino acid transport system substrate-binding protein
MVDTYKVQNCHALAGEITTLAAVRLDPGVSHISSHILPETLAVFPVIAATGPSDGQWAAIIG